MPRETIQLAVVEWKVAGDAAGSGEVEGYAAVYGNVDHQGDVVVAGAFNKTIADQKRASRPIPLIADHNLSTDGVVGRVTMLADDGVGLRFRAQFSSVQKAQDLRTNVLEGNVGGTSFIAEIIRSRITTMKGEPVRLLQELALKEITLTPFPANELAGVTAAKSDDISDDGRAAWEADLGTALKLGNPSARKAALDAIVPAYPTASADAPDGDATDPIAADDSPAEGDATEKSDQPDIASAYALSIIHTTDEPSDGTLEPDATSAIQAQVWAAKADDLEADLRRSLEA